MAAAIIAILSEVAVFIIGLWLIHNLCIVLFPNQYGLQMLILTVYFLLGILAIALTVKQNT